MSEKVICKNCGHHFTGKFCNHCGEKVYNDHDKKLGHFFEEGLHFVTHFEGKLFTSLKTIFTKPGQLSTDYCNGIRKKYFKPLSLFLLLVVLYLIFPFFEGLNMRLEYYPNEDYYGGYAAKVIESKVVHRGMSYEAFANKFHAKGEKVSKFLLIILIPLTALVFYVLAFKKRKYLFDHMVFAAEINSVYLLWGFFVMPLLLTLVTTICKWITGDYLNIGDMAIGIIMYAVLSLYTLFASRKFYGFIWWQRLLFTIVFNFAHIFIVYILYKFLLFIIVINQM
jgi:Protein of unknown function (DUF3667)